METAAITVSRAAAAHVNRVLAQHTGAPKNAGLRIDVVAGGCSGYQYRLALDDSQADDWVDYSCGCGSSFQLWEGEPESVAR